MKSFIKNVEVTNFKSIKNLKLNDCKRINLIVGKPNTGKSNFVEALSLFSLVDRSVAKGKKLSSFVRLENDAEIFNYGNTQASALIKADDFTCEINYGNISSNYKEFSSLKIFSRLPNENITSYSIDKDLRLKSNKVRQGIFDFHLKRYSFKENVKFGNGTSKSLNNPYGENLMYVINNYEKLKTSIEELLLESNVNLLFDQASKSLKLQRVLNNKDIFNIPFHSIADTLQRLIFYKTAVYSNFHSVLLFEEPEAQCYQPFMVSLTQDILNHTENQFFITTHSNFILTDFLENNQSNDIAIYVFYNKDNNTNCVKLSEDKMNKIIKYGIDLLLNLESFYE